MSKANKILVALVTVVFLALATGIFWFLVVRPGQLKASCAKEADDHREFIIDLNKLKGEDGKGHVSIGIGKELDKVWDTDYEQCLRRKGII